MSTVNEIERPIKTPEGENVKLLVKGRGLIVEFVGPPGAGKTTNCIYFLEFFRKLDLNVYAFTDIKAFLYRLGFVEQLQIYLQAIILNGGDFVSYCLLLLRHGIYSLDAVYRYVKLCVFNRALHHFISQHDVDVVFLDQWIIQGLWSATIFKNRSTQKLQEELQRFYFKADLVLYFDLDDDTACDRIHLRDHGRSRFDKMDKGRRLRELNRTTPYLYRLFKNSACQHKFQFSARRSTQNNAEDFLRQLWFYLKRIN